VIGNSKKPVALYDILCYYPQDENWDNMHK